MVHKYTWSKLIYFVASAVLSAIMLSGIGSALQHVDISSTTIALLFTIFTAIVSLVLDYLVLSNSILDGLNDLWFKVAFVLFVGPQFVTYIARLCCECNTKAKYE